MIWQKFSRSELLSTFFPSWVWQGRQWSKGKVPKYDPHFWLAARSHPVLSTYYPPAIFTSILSALGDSLDVSFIILCWSLWLHAALAFVGYFILIHTFANTLIALFGAITLTFSAYNWKQQPCFIYTIAWFPWLLTGIATHNILLTSVAFGMVILAGYYPIGIQIAIIAGCATMLWNCPPTWIPIGALIGSPQLIPFIKYLPKTIRANKHDDIGKVPWWHPISLLAPKLLRHNLNGVGYWEMAYYVGIVPLVLVASSTSRASLLGVVSYFLMIGVGSKFFPRIPARWCFSFQFALGWCAVSGLINLHLTERVLAGICLVQAFDLIWHNADLIPTSPYSELYNKPSRAFNTRLTRYLEGVKTRVSGLPYPLFTGHINELFTLGYSGGMQLRLMAKWRMDRNPNGSGGHDFFRDNIDGECIDRARVEYAYTAKKLNWENTRIPRLYRNPRLKIS